MRRSLTWTAGVLLATASLAGCSAGGGSGAAAPSGSVDALTGTIAVDAAASLTEAFGTLAAQFGKTHPGVTVKLNFGASSELSTQIGQGAPVDVFASASAKNMSSLGTQARTPVDFVSNTLEIATPPNNPARIAAVADLAKPGVKVAVCDPTVPCGAVAAQVFRNAKIRVSPVAREADVKSTLAAVESGEVDAGLVYVTDARSAGRKVHAVPIPASVNASTKYPIATLASSRNRAPAEAFVAYVLSPAGRKVLMADGFADP